MSKIKDMSGIQFSKLTVIEAAGFYIYPKSKCKSQMWKVRCECGKEKIVNGPDLRLGKVKSCGCLNKSLAKERCKEIQKEGAAAASIFNRKGAEETAWKRYYDSYKMHSAFARGIEFSLPFEQFKELVKKKCAYCNSSPHIWENYFKQQKRKYAKKGHIFDKSYFKDAILKVNGIDRVDNNIGYISDNCVPCCTICNRAKRDRTKEEFLTWAQSLVNFQMSLKDSSIVQSDS